MVATTENGPGAVVAARGPATGGTAPMATRVYGATTRRPVYSGNRRVPGLYERVLADGATVYEARLRLGGAVKRHTLEARTKTDAIAEIRALQVDYERGETHRSPSAALTLRDLSVDYLVHLQSRVGDRDPRRRFSQRTVDLYRSRLEQRILPELGHRPAADFTVRDVRRLADVLSKAKLAPATVTATLNILSGLCRWAVKAGQMEHNPVRDLDRDDRPGSARQSEPRYLTAREIESILARLSDTFRPVVACCVYAALRISEALGLTWRDIDFTAKTIIVRAQLGPGGARAPLKTEASAATLPLLPALERELKAHRSRQAGRDLRRVHANALVFTTSRGKPQNRRNALRAIYTAGDAVGLNGDDREPVGLHDMRHSFVALLLASGGSLAEAAALARHASTRVTAQVYAGITDDARETAAARLVEAGFGG